ncbi:MAG: 30S ribosomal protein S9 [Candidatus Omnitrophica bacterium]|nr:30S ribosomal protein S9 [Candidatus Omnitrophota bacterium]
METVQSFFMGVGRRKTATAVVKLKAGSGNIVVNRKPLSVYLPLKYQQEEVIQPLSVTGLQDRFDVEIKTEGGGVIGQIGAIKLGLARALAKYDSGFTARLREFGLLTRDSRMKERKKYGQKGARKRFQWTKR